MEVVSLVDNNRLPYRKDLCTEHGLALCVFTEKQQILSDTGASSIFRSNAERLNVDIAHISLAVLSHHHFDHGGGLAAFLEANTQAKIYLQSSSTEHLCLHLFGLFRRRIGLDESLFQHYPQRFTFINKFSEIAPDVFILTKIGERHSAPKNNRHLFIHKEHSDRLDDFEHELILVV
jgi:7,8-dihydropterin-6-yl-methyl-4-(beta-D-ribofuranosyl)aminobenzene 5'-phosphate synthase